ncbi:UNVERIFIED_CONTAM: hypothetical protein GTU68_060758 [Idotea baltica]|nr:hypothetical protein [Idotea baltica]
MFINMYIVSITGIEVLTDFIKDDEEAQLLKHIDEVPWDLSQSGRYKQNYGPKCNFKKRKVNSKTFEGYPLFTEFIQERFKSLDLLSSFEAVEQCSLDYSPDRGSSIDPHIDDCWVWGERIPTLSMAADSVLTLIRFKGHEAKYNLIDAQSYPRVVGEDGIVKEIGDVERELRVLNGSEEVKEMENGFDRSKSFVSQDGMESIEKGENNSEKEAKRSERVCNSLELKPSGNGIEDSKSETETFQVIRIPMPRRSLMVLYGGPRYEWEHCILREDVMERRVCITYRELTPTFLPFGPRAEAGAEILRKSKKFWDHKDGKAV